MARWLVVALSGVTNGGKTTLATKLMKKLPKGTRLIKQDDYFYSDNDPHHIPCPGGIQHNNWDVITALDMNQMIEDVRAVINSSPKSSSLADTLTLDRESEMSGVCKKCPEPRSILLLDGFMLFAKDHLVEMCDLRFFYTLPREECWKRRQERGYTPPDPPGYFEKCVWPMYVEHLDYVSNNVNDVTYLDGSVDHFSDVLRQVLSAAGISAEINENNGKIEISKYCQCDHAEKKM